jgi:hypothetical protein
VSQAAEWNGATSPEDEWELFQSFTDIGSAEVMCAWLLSEDVPARVDTVSFQSQLEMTYRVFVRRDRMHRAKWVVAQPPLSDAELDYLATGKLPGTERE